MAQNRLRTRESYKGVWTEGTVVKCSFCVVSRESYEKGEPHLSLQLSARMTDPQAKRLS